MISLPSEVGGLFLFGTLSFFLLWLAKKRGFFALQEQRLQWATSLKWYHVIIAFSLYFSIAFLLSLAINHFLLFHVAKHDRMVLLRFATWTNFTVSLSVLATLLLYCSYLPRQLVQSIWRRKQSGPLKSDLRAAFFCWVLSFPLVLFMNNLLDLIVYFIFRLQEIPEQLAVHFLRMAVGHPFYLFLVLLVITILAPLIEETLFRGFLQSFIRQHLGSKQAIGITALCFSFFHYAPEQGIGNLPIVGSLFVLALFLGFLYESSGSLFASISLHAAFNGISALNLLFFGVIP